MSCVSRAYTLWAPTSSTWIEAQKPRSSGVMEPCDEPKTKHRLAPNRFSHLFKGGNTIECAISRLFLFQTLSLSISPQKQRLTFTTSLSPQIERRTFSFLLFQSLQAASRSHTGVEVEFEFEFKRPKGKGRGEERQRRGEARYTRDGVRVCRVCCYHLRNEAGACDARQSSHLELGHDLEHQQLVLFEEVQCQLAHRARHDHRAGATLDDALQTSGTKGDQGTNTEKRQRDKEKEEESKSERYICHSITMRFRQKRNEITIRRRKKAGRNSIYTRE